jgi:hypothetical protein
MIYFLPFACVLGVLLWTQRMTLALLLGILSSSWVYVTLLDQTYASFFFSFIPQTLLGIVSPSQYLFPILFFLIMACLIELFEEMEILDSYQGLLQNFFASGGNLLFKGGILFSSVLFFLDDYLGMFGIKNFFSPLLKNTDSNKKELALWTTFLASPPTLLFFFSTWSVVITKQLETIFSVFPFSDVITPALFFAHSRKYFFYPIIVYLVLGATLFWANTVRTFTLVSSSKTGKKIIWLDIISFLLIPFGIAFYFFYEIALCGLAFSELDVAFVMTKGVCLSGITVLFLLMLYKSVTPSYIASSFAKTIKNNVFPLGRLLLCWLFSAIIFTFLEGSFSFAIPEGYYTIIPFCFFIFSTFVGAIIGSEWTGISLMLPFLQVLLNTNLSVVSFSFGAIISGIVAGAHASPFSNPDMMISVIFEQEAFTLYKYRLPFFSILFIISAAAYLVAPWFIF